VSGRISNADIIRAQEARIDSLTLLVESFLALERERLEAERERSRPTASESVKIARSGTGDHTTAVAVEVVPQEGETLQEARARAMVEYEAICARYPMANGHAHAAGLSGEAPTLAEQLERSASDELASRRAKGVGKDGAK